MTVSANTHWEGRAGGDLTFGGGFVWQDMSDPQAIKWTASGSGTDEYYAEDAAGGDPSIDSPGSVMLDGNFNLASQGTAGSLAAGEWEYALDDPGGVYNTLHVRLTDGTDPDTKGAWYVAKGVGVGVDYTQQASPVDEWDGVDNNQDLAAAADSTTLTSAGGGFIASHVGNMIYIDDTQGGSTNFNTGWYEITVYTNANTVTLDRSPTDPGLGASGGYGTIGGAVTLGGSPDTFLEQLEPGNTVHVEDGTHTLTAAVVVTKDGTANLPIRLAGYKTTRGDVPAGTDRPTIACGANAFQFDNYWQIENFEGTGTGATLFRVDQYSTVRNCTVTNSSGSNFRPALNHGSSHSSAIQCELVSTNGDGILPGSVGRVERCYIHDSDHGINLSSSFGVTVLDTVFDNNADGVRATTGYSVTISGCVFYSHSNGALTGTTGYLWRVTDSIFLDNAWHLKWNNSGVPVRSMVFDHNVWYGATSGRMTWDDGTTEDNCRCGPNDLFTDPDFVDAANGDFTVNSGSPVLDAGMRLGVLIGLTGEYKRNIGPDQDDNAAGGGAASILGGGQLAGGFV